MPRTQEASWKNNKQSQSNSDQFFAFFRSMAIAKSEYQESLDIMLLGRRRGITENGRRGSFPIVSSLSLYRKLYFLFVLNYSCLECKDSAPTNKQKRFSSIAFRTDVIFESPTKLFDWWIFAITPPHPKGTHRSSTVEGVLPPFPLPEQAFNSIVELYCRFGRNQRDVNKNARIPLGSVVRS